MSSLLQVYYVVFRSKRRRKYIENGNLVKTKMETVPLSQTFKDDRMTTWRLLRHSMQFSERLPWRKLLFVGRVIVVTYILTYMRLFSDVEFGFILVHEPRGSGGRRVFLGQPTHEARCTGSPCHSCGLARLKRAAGRQIDTFSST